MNISSLIGMLTGRGLNFSWTIPWTGAEADKCKTCDARRDAHPETHNFVEDK